MAAVKFSVKLDFIKEVMRVGNRPTMNKIGKLLKAATLNDLRKGLSPVTGRRLEQYSNPSRYPGNKKQPRPVNLKLTGALWRSFAHKVLGLNKLEYGMLKGSSKVKAYGVKNNEGTMLVAERRFLPTRKGELYRSRIQKQITKVIDDRVRQIIKKTTKR